MIEAAKPWFSEAEQTAAADATITYTVGPTAGHAIFDLRQTISEAWLDGAMFPVAQLAHHTFGSGAFTDLRVIESFQGAGSVHALRVKYALELPDAQLGGSYLPAIDWSAGPKLRFVFGLSDLNRARYAEAWLPARRPVSPVIFAVARGQATGCGGSAGGAIGGGTGVGGGGSPGIGGPGGGPGGTGSPGTGGRLAGFGESGCARS